MRFGRGSDMVWTRFGRGSDVARTWLGRVFGRVFGSGANRLAEVKGKWFPAASAGNHFGEVSPDPSWGS